MHPQRFNIVDLCCNRALPAKRGAQVPLLLYVSGTKKQRDRVYGMQLKQLI